jgi:hypothetical protein
VPKFSRARVACHCLVVLFAGGAAFARGSGRGSRALATARGDSLRHVRTVSIAWVGVMGGSAARAPAVAVVGSVVCLRSSLHRAILNRLDLDLARQCRGGSLFSGRVQSGWPVSHPDFVRAYVSGVHKSAISLAESQQIVLQLLIPFVAGQLSRPWIGRGAQQIDPFSNRQRFDFANCLRRL